MRKGFVEGGGKGRVRVVGVFIVFFNSRFVVIEAVRVCVCVCIGRCVLGV